MTKCRRLEMGSMWVGGVVITCMLLLLSVPVLGSSKRHSMVELRPPARADNFDCLPSVGPENGGDSYDLDVVAAGIQRNVQYLVDGSGNPPPDEPRNYVSYARGNSPPTDVQASLNNRATIFYFWGHGWGSDQYGHGGGIKCGDKWLVVRRCTMGTLGNCRCKEATSEVLDCGTIMSHSKCRLAVLSGCYTAYPVDGNGVPYNPTHPADDTRHGNLTWELRNNGGIETVLGFAGATSYLEPCELWATKFWQSLCQPVAAGFDDDGIPRTVEVAAQHAARAVYDYMGQRSWEGYNTWKICGNPYLRIVPVLKPRGAN